jgi:hypothetical protein
MAIGVATVVVVCFCQRSLWALISIQVTGAVALFLVFLALGL